MGWKPMGLHGLEGRDTSNHGLEAHGTSNHGQNDRAAHHAFVRKFSR